LKFTAEDPHGATTNMFLTIKVRDTKPDFRDDERRLETVYIVENTQFSFVLQNDLFFDPSDERTLIIFPSN